MRGERRVITMLFCDVTGSTAMAEQLDPEEWAEIMNQAFDYLIAPVYRYEGTLARMTGDGLLAFFGAPIAHEDDPQRAVLAGLDIIADLVPFRAAVAQAFGLDFNVRVGINTGPVVVGEIGSDLALEYTAMGDAINLAARMETTAAPGTVQISTYTHRLVAPLFELEPLGPIQVKGKEAPIDAYRVKGRAASPGRLRGIRGHEASLVGRSTELAVLRRAGTDLADGRGGILMLIGEAGLGKSRLISELKDLLTESGLRFSWNESQGVPYERNRPYSLFYQLINRSLGVTPDLSPEEVRRRITLAYRDEPDEQRRLVAGAIEALLAVDTAEGEPQIAAEALKRQLQDSLYHSFRESAREQPMVWVFDDLHWADSASVELLAHLMTLAQEGPLLFVCAMRPYRDAPGWRLRQEGAAYREQYREMALAPLSSDESDNLVSALLTVAELPPETRRLILSKAEGNPLYVEEVVRSLIESGAIARDAQSGRWRLVRPVAEIDIPDSLQALLVSRIDHLEQQTKRTLQLASVIGRTFYERVLAQIAGSIRNLAERLDTLEDADLIYGLPLSPEAAYIFRHELTRDATYRTILRSQRRLFHRRVGEALEQLFPERLNEEAHRLAYHFERAGDREKALTYTIRAGDVAARLFANDEAAGHYRQALALAKEVGSFEQLTHVYTKLGRTLEYASRYDEAEATYQDLLGLGEAREEDRLIVAGLVAMAPLYATYTDRFDPPRAKSILSRALALAEQLDDHAAQARVHWIRMMLLTNAMEEPLEAVAAGKKSLAIAEAHGLEEQLAYALHDLARPLHGSGALQEATETTARATELFRRQGNLPMLADNLSTRAIGEQYLGRFEHALTLGDEGLRISRSVGNLWGQAYALAGLASIYMEVGRIDDTVAAWQEAMALAAAANFAGLSMFGPGSLGLLYTHFGQPERAEALMATILDGMDERYREYVSVVVDFVRSHALYVSGKGHEALELLPPLEAAHAAYLLEPILYAMFLEVAADVRLAVDDPAQVLDFAIEARDNALRSQYRVVLPHLRLIEGRALAALGRQEEAVEALEVAWSEADHMGCRLVALSIASHLARLKGEAGHTEEARSLRGRAREMLEFVAANTGDQQLRDSFLERADIRFLMD